VTTTNRTDARPENEPENVSSIICRFRSAFYRLRLAASDLACGEFVEKCHSHAGLVMQEATNDLEKVYEDLRAWHMHDDPALKAAYARSAALSARL
jgi:hypothetical protein